MTDMLLRCAALLALLGFVTSALCGCQAMQAGFGAFDAQMNTSPGYGRVYDCRGGCIVHGPVYRRY